MAVPAEGHSLPVLHFEHRPEPILKAAQEYQSQQDTVKTPNSNFLKGAKWSPDGACLLTASDDNRLRVYDVPQDALERAALGGHAERDGLAAESLNPRNNPAAETLNPRDSLAAEADNFEPALRMAEGELVYDYAWFPAMQAADPVSCVFASTSRAHPLHLWDACNGCLRCTYRAYDAVDEVTAATSVAFSPDGSRLFGGFNRAIRVWQTDRPGRDYREIVTHRKGEEGLPGIVSSLAFNPDRSGLMAAGSYSGQAGLFDDRTNELLSVLQGQRGGITQVQFAPDGNFVFTGARADPEIWCWDVRFGSGLVYKLTRDSGSTNQRIHFDIEPCGRHLATGGQGGHVRVFDLTTGAAVHSFHAATVNGFEFHPYLPLAATASGHRRFTDVSSDDSDDGTNGALANSSSDFTLGGLENVLMVWRFQHEWMALEELVENAGSEEAGGAVLSTQPEVPPVQPGAAAAEDSAAPANPNEAAQEGSGLPKAQPEKLYGQRVSPHKTGFAGLPKLVPFGQELLQERVSQ